MIMILVKLNQLYYDCTIKYALQIKIRRKFNLDKLQINNEIIKLNKKIKSLQYQNISLKKEMNNIENSSSIFSKFLSSFERYLEDCFSASKTNSMSLSEGNKFGMNYLNELNSILNGTESNNIRQSVSDSKRSASIKTDEIEKTIVSNNKKIELYRSKILEYKKQLNALR